MADEIISRAEALAQGRTTFFTGIPCRKGHLAPRRISGVRGQPCTACEAEYYQRWYSLNRERKRNYAVAAQAADPEAFKAANRKYALKHRGKNIEKARECARRWYSDPANRRVRYNARRRRHHAGGEIAGAGQLRALLVAQHHRCAYCSADLHEVKNHLDHIMPLVLGGSNGIENLQWLCAPCNLAKGAKHPDVFAAERASVLT